MHFAHDIDLNRVHTWIQHGAMLTDLAFTLAGLSGLTKMQLLVTCLSLAATCYMLYRPTSKPLEKFLNKTRQTVKLIKKEYVSHDTIRFRFGLPSSAPVLGLPVGKCIKVFAPNPAVGKAEWNPRPESARGPAVPHDNGSGEGDFDSAKQEWRPEIVRKYTPCTLDSDLNHFDLVLKVYSSGHQHFPHGGKVSQYMGGLKVGDTLDIQGPFGHMEYLGKMEWKKYGKRTKLGMIAGGTGVTPFLQIIQSVLNDPNDTTEMSLLFANQTEEDILVRDMLETWAKEHPARFKVWYTLDRPPAVWSYSTGFINEEMLRAHIPLPSPETLVLMCGPPPMIKFACRPNLEKIGHPKSAVASF